MKSINDVKLNYLVQKIKSLFSPKEHTHDLTEDVSGILPVENGGTGVTNLADINIPNRGLKCTNFNYTGTTDNYFRFLLPDSFEPKLIIINASHACGISTILPVYKNAMTYYGQGHIESEQSDNIYTNNSIECFDQGLITKNNVKYRSCMIKTTGTYGRSRVNEKGSFYVMSIIGYSDVEDDNITVIKDDTPTVD